MPHVELPQAEFKVVMLGDTTTGKTSLVLRFAEGYFREQSRTPTVGAFFITKRIQVQGITCKVQIWDTAGQKQFRIMGKMYYQNAAAAILCYDVSSRHSFEVCKYWLEEVHRNIKAGSIVICICATKADLLPVVPPKEVETLAHNMGAMFVETSAKDNTNVTLLYKKVAERVLQFQQTARRAGGATRNIPVTPGAAIDQSSGQVVKSTRGGLIATGTAPTAAGAALGTSSSSMAAHSSGGGGNQRHGRMNGSSTGAASPVTRINQYGVAADFFNENNQRNGTREGRTTPNTSSTRKATSHQHSSANMRGGDSDVLDENGESHGHQSSNSKRRRDKRTKSASMMNGDQQAATCNPAFVCGELVPDNSKENGCRIS